MKSAWLMVKPEQKRLFEETFKTPLSRFFDGLFGFNVVAFDKKFIKPKKNESTKDAVTRMYGIEASTLVGELLGCLERRYNDK